MDSREFTTLYCELAPALHVWAELRVRPLLRGHCETSDLLQEIWFRAYTIRERFDPERVAFRPWLFQVAKHVLLESVRDARSNARLGRGEGRTSHVIRMEQVADEVTSISRKVASDETLRQVHASIDALPEPERDLVLHIGLEGRSYAEVATQMGLSHEALKKRWQRLRSKLELGELLAS